MNYNSSIVAAALQDHITKRLNGISTFENTFTNVKKFVSYKKPVAKSVIVTRSKIPAIQTSGQIKNSKNDYILKDFPNKKNTLAESLGLIISTQIIISDEQWKKQKHNCLIRGDFSNPCPICQEEFKLHPVLLLSCSHVFHRNCIESFEKYSKKMSCPICRASDYQKMVTFQPEQIYLNKCATRIQSIWRGYKQLKWYQSYNKKNAPKNMMLKTKWLHNKVNEVTDRYISALELSDIDKFISDLDESVILSKKVFDEWDKMNICRDNELVDKWSSNIVKCKERMQGDCSICLQNWSKCRTRVILSCSHIFHKICLLTFESIQSENREWKKTCPLCREIYERKDINGINYELI